MSSVRKVITAVSNLLFWITIIVLVLVTALTMIGRISGNNGITFGNFGFGRVVTGSMEPEIPTGSFICIQKTAFSDLSVGDVITFYSDDPNVPPNTPVSHKIERVETDLNGQRSYITKGVANEIEDSYPVYEYNYIGKVVYSSLIIGNIISFAKKPFIYPILIVLLLISLVQSIMNVIEQWRSASSDSQK